MATILGLNWGHDGSACIVREGRLVCAISNERLSRHKKMMGVSKEMLEYVLAGTGLSLGQIDLIAFAAYFYSPDNYLKVLQQNGSEVRAHLTNLHGGQTHAECLVQVEGARIKGLFTSHHLAHCAAAFYTSPFERAACFSVDASAFHPESCSLFMYGEGNKLHYQYCPGVMIGNAYDQFTEKLGLGPGLTKAGTLMGLAPYGEVLPIARERWEEFGESYYRRQFQDSDPLYIDYLWSRIAGVPRHFKFPREESDKKRAMDIAASIQFVFEQTMLKNARLLHAETESFNDGNLVLGGGSFLNSETNMRIKNGTPFSAMHLFPACGDDGTAAGAALYAAHHLLNYPRQRYSTSELMYLGRTHEVPASLRARGVPYDADAVAADIAAGKVVAFFSGRSEFGPRALGARSILADPRRKEMVDHLNQTIKKREWFRPFAPVVLAEKVSEWFGLGFDSPFMLFIAKVLQPERVPAVSHVDGTARVQTIRRHDNPKYYDLIAAFERQTGVPVLLNTSLNGNNEPLAETPDDALRFFESTATEVLVVEDVVVRKG